MIVYKITSPTGKVYDNISNLKDFCEEYSLNFKGIRKRSYNENGVKLYAGWQVRKYDDEFDVLDTDVHTDEMACFNCGSTYEYSDNHYCSKCGHGLEKRKKVKATDPTLIKNQILKNVFIPKQVTDNYKVTVENGNFVVKNKYIPDPSVEPEIPEPMKKVLEDFNEPPTKENNEEFNKYSQYGLTTDELLQKAIMENSNLKKKVKELTVENSINKIVGGIIKEAVPQVIISNPSYVAPSNKGKISEELILVLSDLHADQVVKSSAVQGLEEFNFNVACNRAEVLIDSVISFTKNTLNSYQYDTINILMLGDFCNGEVHNAEQFNHFKNSLKASMAIGELLSNMILDLSQHFKKVNVECVVGNHGRKMDGSGNHNINHRTPLLNYDYLTYSYAASRLHKLIDSNVVNFNIPDSYSSILSIQDHNIHISHGHNIRGVGAGFYGLTKKTAKMNSLMAGFNKKIDYYFIGHFHQSSSIPESNSTIFMSPAFIATDEFALNSLYACSTPSQFLCSIGKKRGITWRMPIMLRPPVDNWMELESKEPKRYNIRLFE